MNNFKSGLCATALLALGAAAASAAPLNLVSNGGFVHTTGITQSSNLATTIGSSESFVDNWYIAPSGTNLPSNGGIGNNFSFVYMPGQATTTGALSYHPTTGAFTQMTKLWAATESATGGNFITIDGDPIASGYIYQDLHNLTIGQKYSLSFDYAGAQFAPLNGDTTEAWHVQFGNDIASTAVLANVSHGFTGWVTQTFNFVASNTSQRLSFLALGTPAGLPPVSLLDNVSLTAVEPPPPPVDVPEPASLALMLTGLLGIGAVRRRTQRQANKAA